MGATLKTVGDFDWDEIHELSMDSVEYAPERFQTRAEIHMGTVDKWAKRVRKEGVPLKSWPPVIILVFPDGRMILADGFHRWHLYKKLGKKSIRAIIVPAEDDGEVLLRGIKENLQLHEEKERQVTEADRTHAVEMMIRNETFQDRGEGAWSDTRIGEVCGVSGSTVFKIRARLAAEEGVPLPARIKRFSTDGTWDGRTGPYRKVLDSKPRLSLHKRGDRSGFHFESKVGGKTIYLGNSEEEAQAKLDEIYLDHEAIRMNLTSNGGFISWLNHRGVAARGLSQEGSLFGAILVADAVLFAAPVVTQAAVLEAAGKALFYRKHGGTAPRLILVGYPGETMSAGRLVRLLGQEPIPIGFMTPEEIVAEFGPRSEAEPPGPE